MHAPAGCLKTPACLHSAQQSCGIHGCRAERGRARYPLSLRLTSFSSHVLFSSVSSVFSGCDVTRKQATDSSCQKQVNMDAAAPGNQTLLSRMWGWRGEAPIWRRRK